MAALPLPPALAIRDEPFTDEDLDDFIDARAAGLPAPAAVGKFIIDDDSKAEWAGRRFRDIDAARDAAIEQANQWSEQIDEWLDAELARLGPRAAVFEEALKRYAINRRTADEKNNKTTSLPSVTVSTRKPTTSTVHIANQEVVEAWARTLDADALRAVAKITIEVQVSKLRKVAEVPKGKTVALYVPTGEAIPGTYVTPPETTASVAVNQ